MVLVTVIKGLATLQFLGDVVFKTLASVCSFLGFSASLFEKSMAAFPSPMYSFPSNTCAWHCRQLGATSTFPLAALIAVKEYGSLALMPVRCNAFVFVSPPVMRKIK